MSELAKQYIAITVGDTTAFKSWATDKDPLVDGFTIDFEMTRTNKGEPNKGNVTITNPPEAMALALVQSRQRPLVRVLFGWEPSGLRLVGGGNPEKDGVKLTYAGADSKLTIGFLDGIAALRGSYIAQKFPRGTMLSEVVRQTIIKSGLPPGVVTIAPEDDTLLQPGMVITCEPGYCNDIGCFDIEENVLVTETGYEVLSGARRELYEIATDC